MTLGDLASLGQIIGAIAVVISLLGRSKRGEPNDRPTDHGSSCGRTFRTTRSSAFPNKGDRNCLWSTEPHSCQARAQAEEPAAPTSLSQPSRWCCDRIRLASLAPAFIHIVVRSHTGEYCRPPRRGLSTCRRGPAERSRRTKPEQFKDYAMYISFVTSSGTFPSEVILLRAPAMCAAFCKLAAP